MGCQGSDAEVDDDGKKDVGFVLVAGKSLKQDDVLVIRTWWKNDRPDGSATKPRIYQVFVSVDPTIVTKALKDNNNSCGHGKISSIPQPRLIESVAKPAAALVAHH